LVDAVAGDDEEKQEYSWGALGHDVDDIVGLLRILERHLAQRGAATAYQA
jgi:hypothetical protein